MNNLKFGGFNKSWSLALGILLCAIGSLVLAEERAQYYIG